MATMKHTTKKSSTPQKAPAVSAGAAPAGGVTPPASPTPPASAAVVNPSASPVTSVANGNGAGTKVAYQTSLLAIIAGLQQYYAPGDVFSLPMGELTRDDIIAKLQGVVQIAEQTKADYSAWRQQVQSERAAALQIRPLQAGVKSVVTGRFGKGANQLLDFGYPPVKPSARTTETKAAAVAKAKATREARGTKGSVQKQEVSGNVTGVVITPMVAGPSVPADAGGASESNGASAPAAPVSPPPAATPSKS